MLKSFFNFCKFFSGIEYGGCKSYLRGLGVIYVTLNKKGIFLRVFDVTNFCSPKMSRRGMMINI